LVTGEKGTGKEMIAASMHFNSPRASNNFVSVHCGTMHGNPLEEELFGYEKGASTQANKRRIGRIEQANGGTLFLQEIGELPGTTQAKILRTIQLKQFERLGGTQKVQIEARLICSSSQDLKQNIAKGAFREDLFYRINAIQIHLPPLRERIEDIPALAQFFLHKFRGQHGKRDIGFAPNAIEMMMEYNWPGNVGELEVVVNRALMLCSGDSIVPEDLKFSSAGPPNGNESFALNGQSLDLEQLERTAITQALEQAKGVQKDAAKLLGISPRVIHYKIQKHNIDA
jgi:DNA-binding NtrC family response regulator